MVLVLEVCVPADILTPLVLCAHIVPDAIKHLHHLVSRQTLVLRIEEFLEIIIVHF